MSWIGSALGTIALLALACGTDRSAARISPISDDDLLAAPNDPVRYHEIRLSTRSLLAAQDSARAEPLARWLTQAYPRDGENWFLLGQAQARLGNHGAAAASFEQAASRLGWRVVEFSHDPANTRYALGLMAAAEHLRAGNKRAALDLLRTVVERHHYPFRGELFNHEADFAALREDPEFREIAGRPDTSGWSRDYGWRRDIDYLSEAVHRINPDFRDRALPDEFVRIREELKEMVPVLSDEQIFVGMNRMLATLRQGHTWLSGFPADHPSFRQLPLQFYVFPEGIFIFDSDDPHRDLVGSKVIAINGVPALEVLRRVNELQSVDGDMEYLLTGPGLMRKAYVLKGLGIISSVDKVSLTVSAQTGRRRVIDIPTVRAGPGTKLKPPPGVSAPLFLRNVTQAHWEQRLPEQRAVYVQLNQVRNDPDESLAAFSKRLTSILAGSGAKNLIIDMRLNTGGATGLYPDFLRSLAAFSQDPDNQIYVLIGRSTYSAAANLLTDMERFIRPIFVGEASSECCALHGDPDTVVLPYSGITGAVTAVEWNLSHNVFDGRRAISPHAPVTLSANDYFAGRDPVLKTALEMARRRTVQAPASQLDGAGSSPQLRSLESDGSRQ